VKSRFPAFYATPISCPWNRLTEAGHPTFTKRLSNRKKIMPSAKISSFFVYKQKKAHIFVTQTRREKIGCETGSSKFQLLEKDY